MPTAKQSSALVHSSISSFHPTVGVAARLTPIRHERRRQYRTAQCVCLLQHLLPAGDSNPSLSSRPSLPRIDQKQRRQAWHRFPFATPSPHACCCCAASPPGCVHLWSVTPFTGLLHGRRRCVRWRLLCAHRARGKQQAGSTTATLTKFDWAASGPSSFGFGEVAGGLFEPHPEDHNLRGIVKGLTLWPALSRSCADRA
jgi:hypothetical protein